MSSAGESSGFNDLQQPATDATPAQLEIDADRPYSHYVITESNDPAADSLSVDDRQHELTVRIKAMFWRLQPCIKAVPGLAELAPNRRIHLGELVEIATLSNEEFIHAFSVASTCSSTQVTNAASAG